MAEYIDREALLAAYDATHNGAAGGARKLMVDALAADVVEVVRCKECALQSGCKVGQYLGNDGFCSYGERSAV
jgi:hypothetical protein